MKIQNISNERLLSEIKKLAVCERKVGLEILKYICEVERRKCYIDLGYSGLFSYLTKELKYDESSAYKKIESAKLLKEYPHLEEKIAAGSITPTNLTILATTLKKNGVTDKAKKLAIISANENKSKIELQKALFELFPNNLVEKETKRQVNVNEVRISLTISEDLQKKIDKLKSIKSRSKVLSTAELLESLIDEALESEESDITSELLEPDTVAERRNIKTRYVATKIKKYVWKRAKGTCEWVDPVSKMKCNSIFYLQYDHLRPFARGGKSNVDNIRLLCSNHNLHSGIRVFGLKKMKRN